MRTSLLRRLTHSTRPAAAGLKPPRLLDVTWRLDFLISSKELGRVAKPVYRVCFQLEEQGSGAALLSGAPALRSVEVACSPQELEDLAAKLRAALRAAEGLLAAR